MAIATKTAQQVWVTPAGQDFLQLMVEGGGVVGWIDSTGTGQGNLASSGGGSSAFSSLTGGTNTAAAMVIGTGASLNFSGSGTINASSLGGATFAAPGAIGGTTPGAGTFTTLIGQTSVTAGVIGTTSGLLNLQGSTSGTATFTAPAVAGIIQNCITISNSICIPLSNGVGYGFGGIGTSMFTDGTNLVFNVSSSPIFAIESTGAVVLPALSFSFQNNSFVVDTGISRTGTGVIAFGNGTAGDTSGTLNGALYQAGGTSGATAGSFSTITAITAKGGIVTQLTGTSDERLKDSVAYVGGLEQILGITPVSYRWNEKGQVHTGLSGDQEYVGFLAQDVQKQIPEAITATEMSKDGSEEYLSFDDRPVVAALVNAVKQLATKVQHLEARG